MTVGRIPSVEGGIQPTIFDAKGDLLTATANDTPARLAVGNNGETLIADSTAATGLKWAKSENFVGCSVYDSGGSQVIANNVYTALTFNSEVVDTDGFHSTSSNTSRMTIPTGMAGRYLITVNTVWGAAAVGIRGGAFYKNGAILFYMNQLDGSSTANVGNTISYVADLAVGDYLEVFVVQTSGSNQTCYKRFEENPFSIVYLGA
jgi:hypothetical protein